MLKTFTSSQQKSHSQELSSGDRFSFGENWTQFLSVLDEQRISEAENSLKLMLGVDSLCGKTFLDIGSGSGLFSLAARKLGAKVFSFDYDPKSVACTRELKRRYFDNDNDWTVEEGSVLDVDYLKQLGTFDVVYSWGVLHHTGAMWNALKNIESNVAEGGKIFIALYNYQPFASKYWYFVKRIYNKNMLVRPFLVFFHILWPTIPSLLLKKIQGRKYPRGMSPWYDLFDWLGGFPFEVSKPEEIFLFYKNLGYNLVMLKTVGGRMGCNEFVFERND